LVGSASSKYLTRRSNAMKRMAEGRVFGAQQTWEWNQDATGQACAYVRADATGILMQGATLGKPSDAGVHLRTLYRSDADQ
jgi:hypothetical protein